MSNAGILYLRLLRKIVRESAWRLGGAEETYLVASFGGDAVASARCETARSQNPGVRCETSCGQTREQADLTREQA
jgi:hypothetical protein